MIKLNKTYKNYKSYINFFYKYSKYLEPGTYLFSNSSKPIFYRKESDLEHFISMTNNVYYRSKRKKSFILKRIVKRSINTFIMKTKLANHMIQSCDSSCSQALMLLNHGKRIKTFDFKQKLLYTYYSDPVDFKQNEKNMRYFHKHFNTTFKDVDYIKQSIIEKIIIPDKVFHELNEAEKKSLSKNIIHEYTNYIVENNEYSNQYIDLNTTFDYLDFHTKYHHLVKNFKSKYNINENSNFLILPSVPSHRDLGFQNILLKNNDYYIIDFSGKNDVFFFDVMKLLVHQIRFNGDDYLFNLYDAGYFDNEFKSMFNNFNLIFDINHRHFYTIIYLFYRIEWVLKSGASLKKVKSDTDLLNKLLCKIN